MKTKKTVKITTRARNLGFGSDSTPTGRGTEIRDVERPDVVGGLRTIEAECARVQRVYSGGTHYRIALFVGDKRVYADKTDTLLAIAELREFGETIVTLAD